MPKIVSLSSIPRSQYDKLKKSFSCKNEELQKHIKQFAFSHQKEGLFQTYFMVDNDENYLGYISVALATIQREDINDEIDIPDSIGYSIPALKITRLCTFDNYCNLGVGKALVAFANVLAIVQQCKIGCRAIIVDSKSDAVGFYTNLGFIEIAKEENSDTIFMVNDILKIKDLQESLPSIINFCNTYEQNDLVPILEQSMK